MYSSSCFSAFICIQKTCPCQFSYSFLHTKRTSVKNPASVPIIITHLYSIKGIGISSVQTSFPYIMMIWKQWQPADMVKLSDFSPFWLCVPAFQQVCLQIISIFSKNKISRSFLYVNNIGQKICIFSRDFPIVFLFRHHMLQ